MLVFTRTVLKEMTNKWKVLDIDHMAKTGKIRYKFEGTLEDVINSLGKDKK